MRVVRTRAEMRDTLATVTVAGRGGTHRLAVVAQGALGLVVAVGVLAVLAIVATWSTRPVGAVVDPDVVAHLRSAATAAVVAGLVAAALVVAAAALGVLAWWIAVRRHRLTVRSLLRHPTVIDLVAFLVPVVGTVVAARGLSDTWAATRPHERRDRHVMPPVLVGWVLLSLGWQLAPPLFVLLGRLTPDPVDLLWWTTVGGLSLAGLGAGAALALLVVVRTVDGHFDGRLGEPTIVVPAGS